MLENPSLADDERAQASQLRDQLRVALAELGERKRELHELRDRVKGVSGALSEENSESRLREDVRQLLHDVRSPLTAISNWVQLNQADNSDESTRREGLRVVSLSIDEMTSMLNEWAVKIAR